MAQGMKRLWTPVAAFLALALIGMIATSWLINRDALYEAVEAQIRAVTGLDLVVKGPIDVSVFPGSYVSFHDVGLRGGGAADPALRVDVLTANLRLLPLLLRRFEIADVMMLRPQIRVTRSADGVSNWTPFIQTIARTMKPGAENQISFSEIRIQDGILSYEDTANELSEKLDDIDLSLAWPSIKFLQRLEIPLVRSRLQPPAHPGIGLPVIGPADKMVERARHPVVVFEAPVDILLRRHGVEVAPPGAAIAAPLWMQRLHGHMRPPQRRSVDDEALAIAVEQVVGRGAAQPLSHRPDMRLDDALAKRVVEGPDRELRDEVGRVGRSHAATFGPGALAGKAPRRLGEL